MIGTRTKAAIAGALILLAASAGTAGAGAGGVERATMNSFGEVPTLSAAGTGTFRATVNAAGNRINYTLRFNRLRSPVTQAHIHLGRPAIAGGIAAWLCDSAANPGPAGTPPCPAPGTAVTQVIRPGEVQAIAGPPNQGLRAGQFNALVRAIRNNATYVNVHTAAFGGGQIRGMIH